MSRVSGRTMVIIGFMLLLAIGVSAFFGGRMSVYNAHPELTNAEQAEAVLAKVSKLIKLPEGETPSMATIEDAETVKAGQPFLANAENGDILIVYSAAATALLYRPSTDMLIAVGPVDTSVSAPVEETAPVVEEEVPADETDDSDANADPE